MKTTSFYCDEIEYFGNFIEDFDDLIVVKTHEPGLTFRLMIKIGCFLPILTVREPLDCVASLIKQFGWDYDHALRRVERSAASILDLVDGCKIYTLRYETCLRDEFDVASIAQQVGIMPPNSLQESIAQDLSLKQVGLTIERFELENMFGSEATSASFEPQTLWHPRHVGLAKSGIYKEILSESQVGQVVKQLECFRRVFNYSNNDT